MIANGMIRDLLPEVTEIQLPFEKNAEPMPPSQSECQDMSLDSLQQAAEQQFRERFDREPTVLVAAPGRVNLIGEHIDYNDGYVLPLALERNVLIAAAPHAEDSSQNQCRLYSTQLGTTESIDLCFPIQPGRQDWVAYVEGVLAGFMAAGETVAPFDAVVASSVPVGGGLSSSAALEVATATLLEQLTGHQLGLAEKALLCQKAEHEFAGVPCGIMDQFSSVFGKANELMLIDCLTQEVQSVPMADSDISILVTNSNVKHSLTGGEYAARRAECTTAIEKLGKSTWRDVTLDDLENSPTALTEIEYRRARHVVTEIQRTVRAAEAFRQGDWRLAGQLMNASHDSLRDDFEVSCPELDILVDIAREIGVEGGVFGSRMTGGGFGGCTVSLVTNEALSSVENTIASRYEVATGIQPDCFPTRPGQGAHVLQKD